MDDLSIAVVTFEGAEEQDVDRRHLLPIVIAPFTWNTTRYGGQPHPHNEHSHPAASTGR